MKQNHVNRRWISLPIPFFYIFLNLGVYADNVEHAPPKPHVTNTAIYLEQGSVIYGNNQMQAVIRVQYRLAAKREFYEITLREFKTKQKIAPTNKFGEIIEPDNPNSSENCNSSVGRYAQRIKLSRDLKGWTFSECDSGYDHNIGSTGRHFSSSKTLLTSKSTLESKTYYLNSSVRKSWLTVCFDIQTVKKQDDAEDNICTRTPENELLTDQDLISKCELKTYTTCEDEGIMNGSITLFSDAPKIYSGRDFILTKVSTSEENRLDLYALNTGPNIPRGVIFSAKNPKYKTYIYPIINTGIYNAFTIKALSLSLPEEQKKEDFTYATSYQLTKDDKDTGEDPNDYFVTFIDHAPTRRRNVPIDKKSIKGSITGFINYKYKGYSYNNNNIFCEFIKKKDGEPTQQSCFKFPQTTSESNPVWSDAPSNAQFELNLRTYQFPQQKMIELTDNYGTRHKVIIGYDEFGEHNYDLSISN